MTDPESPTSVVVVDDYPDGRELMSAMLRSDGFDVQEAATGREALVLAATQPRLMVVDVDLPDMDGFEVARRIKSEPRTAGIVILQVSAAYREVRHRVRGLDEGADAYLTLPVDRDELLATVRALLRTRRTESEGTSLRAVSALAQAAAHEINNPLSVITGHLHFLAKDPAVPEARVTALRDAAIRIRDIVRQMVRVRRLETVPRLRDLPEMLDLARSSGEGPLHR